MRRIAVAAGCVIVLSGCLAMSIGCAAVAAPVALQMAATGLGAANQGYAVWNGSRLRYVDAVSFEDMNEAVDTVLRELHLTVVRETRGTDLTSDQSEYDGDFDIYYGFPMGTRTETQDFRGIGAGGVEPIPWEKLPGTPAYRLLHVRTETKGLATIEVRRMTASMTALVVNAGPFGDKASVRMLVGRVNAWLIDQEHVGATPSRRSLYRDEDNGED